MDHPLSVSVEQQGSNSSCSDIPSDADTDHPGPTRLPPPPQKIQYNDDDDDDGPLRQVKSSTESARLVTPTSATFSTSTEPDATPVSGPDPGFGGIALTRDPSSPSFDRQGWDTYFDDWIDRVEDGAELEVTLTNQFAGVMLPLISTPTRVLDSQPFFGLRDQLPMSSHIRVPDGTPFEQVKLCRVLQWLGSHASGNATSSKHFERLHSALYLATCSPPSKATPSSTSAAAMSSHPSRRRRTEAKNKRLADRRERLRRDFWGAVMFIYELKLDGLRKGLAQSIAYGVIGFKQCGARVVLYQYKTRFTLILVVDEETVVIETTDDRRWRRMDRIWRVGNDFRSELLPHDLAADPLSTSGEQQHQDQDAGRNPGRDLLLASLFTVIASAATIGIRDKPSRSTLVATTQPAFDRLRARQLPQRSETNGTQPMPLSTTPQPSIEWTLPDADMPPANTDLTHFRDLKELGAICGFARPDELLKTFKTLFPDAVASEDGSGEEEDEGELGRDDDDHGGGGADDVDESGRGGYDKPDESRDPDDRQGGGSNCDTGHGGSRQGGSDPVMERQAPSNLANMGGETSTNALRVSGKLDRSRGRGSAHLKSRSIRLTVESDYEANSDSDCPPERRDPIRHMRKKAAITESKLLVGAMELIGVKVIWAHPGEAIRTLREMCESLSAGTRARARARTSARVGDRG